MKADDGRTLAPVPLRQVRVAVTFMTKPPYEVGVIARRVVFEARGRARRADGSSSLRSATVDSAGDHTMMLTAAVARGRDRKDAVDELQECVQWAVGSNSVFVTERLDMPTPELAS